MEFYKSESLEKPVTLDFSSSPTTVYIRKNIEQVEVDDVETGEKKMVWKYDEAKVSKTDYIAELKSRQDETDEAVQELILAMYGGE